VASVKNTARRKRKYGDQAARTARNKQTKKSAAELHEVKKVERTQLLVGKKVQIRTPDGPQVGTVREVVPAPSGSVRQRGQFLLVSCRDENFVRSRHRVKPV
jgi:hypothetical protein